MTTAQVNLEAALNLRFDSDAGDNLTIREYLYRLLIKLWDEGESFNGKRPFGNSGWETCLYKPLVKAGLIGGDYDAEYDDMYNVDDRYADSLIRDMIHFAMFNK